jgi:YVTN family beta-propeller protein
MKKTLNQLMSFIYLLFMIGYINSSFAHTADPLLGTHDHATLDQFLAIQAETTIVPVSVFNAVPQALPADPVDWNTLGQWGNVINWPHIPVTAANLPDGRVLTFASNEREAFPVAVEFTYAATWDPDTEIFQENNYTGHDMFCGHPVILNDGKILISGGRSTTSLTTIFDPVQNNWIANEPMNDPRWYPTAVALPNDQVFVASGSGGSNSAELWTKGQGWNLLNGINWFSIAEYGLGYSVTNWWPQLVLAPDGKIKYIGPTPVMQSIDVSGNGQMLPLSSSITGWDSANQRGTSVVFNEGKVLTLGGGVNWRKATIVDLNGSTPTVTEVNDMLTPRSFANAVILPNGEIFVVGGNTSGLEFSDEGTVLTPEIWNPDTRQWREVSDHSIPRNYHSVALLLNDGRVLSAGGGLCGACVANHQDGQVYSPPYLFNVDGSLATRPTIANAPKVIGYNDIFTVDVADNIQAFNIIKMSSTTHSTNTDLRFLSLPFADLGNGQYQISSHSNINVMTPGYWMMFAINGQGVPSEAAVFLVTTNPNLVLTNLGDQVAAVGNNVNLQLNALDPKNLAMIYVSSVLPGGLSIDSATGIISGIPTTPGDHQVSVTVSNVIESDTQTFQWQIETPVTVIDSYQSSFQVGTPAPQWQYLWNANGPMGIASNYVPLIWNGSQYDSDGVLGSPDNTDFSWGQLNVRGGHPGPGIAQGKPQITNDIFVIVSRDIPSDGSYRLINALIFDSNLKCGNGGQVQIYLNDTLLTSKDYPNGGNTTFNTNFGQLTTSDTIYIASGPNGKDSCDAFTWDFELAKEISITTSHLSLTSPGDQVTEVGGNVNLQLNALDPNNLALSYAVSVLPGGLSINSTTGVISGIPVIPGIYSINVTVSNINESDSITFQWTIEAPLTVLGSYQTSFQTGSPAPGWQYLWNANGPVGISSNYVPITWNGSQYDSDGLLGSPDNTDFSWGQLNAKGGHTGPGSAQGKPQITSDIFAIVSRAIPVDGRYSLINALITDTNLNCGNGGQVRVYLNDSLLVSKDFPNGGSTTFDLDLGQLTANDTVYIASGPNSSDYCDAFIWDFKLAKAPSVPTSHLILTSPGDQVMSVGDNVDLQLDALDPNNSTLTYEAPILPTGLSINSVTGGISGIPTAAGIYQVSVTVSNAIETDTQSFQWTIEAPIIVLGGYGASFQTDSPAQGWQYLWNANGPMGVAINYVPLIWNGSQYDSDGLVGSPDNTDFSWGQLNATGGHTGPGSDPGQGKPHITSDIFAIAARDIPVDGRYTLINALITDANLNCGNGGQVRVYVNDTLLTSKNFPNGGSTTFNLDFGQLKANDTVYIASGPNGVDYCDAFNWDFELVKETSVVIPLSVEPIISPPELVNSSIAYQAIATGGTNPQYNWAFGDGTVESGNSLSPLISHTFTQPGLYNVSLTVSDSGGAVKKINFVQAIHEALTINRPNVSSTLLYQSRNGNNYLWNVNPDNGTVSVFDTVTNTKLTEIIVGIEPRAIGLAPDTRVWVINKQSASISIIDSLPGDVIETILLPYGSQPAGLVFDPTGTFVYITLEATGKLLKLDADTGAILETLYIGSDPRHISITADGQKILVSRFITPPVPGESTATPETQIAGIQFGGEVVVINTAGNAMVIASTIVLAHSNEPDTAGSGRGIPNYLGAPAITPDGLTAWIPSKQDNILRGALRDGQNLDHDNTVRSISSRINLVSNAENLNDRIDHNDAAMPSSAIYSQFGMYMFTTLEGNRQVVVSDAYTGTKLFHFDVGRAPQGLVISADGKTLFTHNFMDRSVSVHDISQLVEQGIKGVSLTATYNSVANEALTAQVFKGKQLFYDSRDSRLSFEEYQSCASCHNEGDSDGRVWDSTSLGEGLRNTVSLVGHGGIEHGAIHWSGNFDEVQDFEAQIRNLSGGTGLMNDIDFFTGTTSESLGDPKKGISQDLDALAAYVGSLTTFRDSPHRQADGTLTSNGIAGKQIYTQAGCAECHGGLGYTDSTLGLFHDVGTLMPSSGTRMWLTLTGIDTPTLRGIWDTAPYLHNGSASTIADAVNAHNNVNISAGDMPLLVEFLKQIDGNEPQIDFVFQ